jgi:NAD(P)H dehydrogenase (quinone)
MILVTAATGQLGHLIVKDLLERQGSAKGLAVSVRNPEKAVELKAAGVEVRQADYENSDSLKAAFAGVETLMFVSGDAPVEARIRQQRNVVDAAKRAGVKRVIYTSFLDPDPKSTFIFSAVHGDTEAYLKASGLQWTILRAGSYPDISLAQQALGTGVLATAASAGSVSYISREDIAGAAAAAVLDPKTAGKTYELTGPKAVSYPEFAQLVSQVSGKPIQFQAISFEQLGAGLKQAGLPDFVVGIVTGLQQAIGAGRLAKVTDDVAVLTGKPAESYASILKRSLSEN